MDSIYLKNIDIKINVGELIGVIGTNGSGKTILLKMICGKFKNDNILINNKDVREYSLEYKRNNIVCVFNDNIYNCNNCINELKYYLNILKFDESEINERINNFSDYFKLDKIIKKDFIELDIKSRTYIKILSLLIIMPKLFCVDDLFTYLDNDMKVRICNYIRENDITLISITSNMEELNLFDKILIMNKGKKELFDVTSNVLKREDIFNELGLNLPFIYDINSMLKNYELIDRDHIVYKELVDVLWK